MGNIDLPTNFCCYIQILVVGKITFSYNETIVLFQEKYNIESKLVNR